MDLLRAAHRVDRAPARRTSSSRVAPRWPCCRCRAGRSPSRSRGVGSSWAAGDRCSPPSPTGRTCPVDAEVRLSSADGAEVALPSASGDAPLRPGDGSGRRRRRRDPRRRAGDPPGHQLHVARSVRRRRQADVRRAAHARRQLVELSAAPPRRQPGVPGEQRGDLLLPHRPRRHHRLCRRKVSASTARTRPTATVDATVTVSDGDIFLIQRGYHGPCVAAPGYPLYYLNVLAGPGGERSMAFCDDPAHHWVRPSWDGLPIDPRVPMSKAVGKR